jgi:transcriptional regulator with XRE-family HTH domain
MPDQPDPRLVRFGEVIRRGRVLRKLTQDVLAERSGLTRVHVGYAERADKDVQMTTMFRLAEGLGMTPGEVFAAYDDLAQEEEDAAAAAQ